MERKFMQNESTSEQLFIKNLGLVNCEVQTTMTKVIIVYKGNVVAMAGVNNPKHFNYESLLSIATGAVNLEVDA